MKRTTVALPDELAGLVEDEARRRGTNFSGVVRQLILEGLSSAEDLELQCAVDEAERDMAEGHWVDHSEVKAKLKRWAGKG